MVLVPATKRAEKFLHDPNPNPTPTPDPDPHSNTNPDPIPNPNPTPNPSRFLHDLTRKARAPPLHQPTAHAASEALKQLRVRVRVRVRVRLTLTLTLTLTLKALADFPRAARLAAAWEEELGAAARLGAAGATLRTLLELYATRHAALWKEEREWLLGEGEALLDALRRADADALRLRDDCAAVRAAD